MTASGLVKIEPAAPTATNTPFPYVTPYSAFTVTVAFVHVMPSALRYALPLFVTATNRLFAYVTAISPRSDVLPRLRFVQVAGFVLVAANPPYPTTTNVPFPNATDVGCA